MQVSELLGLGGINSQDNLALRKARGAFFTPPIIVEFLTAFAARGDRTAKIL